ncbi:hypothetical protein [Pendulispora albinea]|uniref:Uncharacterized protein n=1 Tax=Pendulispora albinea TaxID=2741071 RepID=A0ABZ2LPL3_9BACT
MAAPRVPAAPHVSRRTRLRRLMPWVLLVVLPACQRGCLSTWLRDHGFAGDFPKPPMPGEPKEAPCPDGLARCRGGVVSVSRAHTPSGPCSPEGCRCPWDSLPACARGCVVEGLEMEMPRESAEKQLCAPDPAAVFAHPAVDPGLSPPPAHDPEALGAFCEVERFHCARGVVHRCDSGQAKPVAVCQGGCIQGEALIVEDIPLEAATALLCVR